MNLQMIPWPPSIILFLVFAHVRLCLCNAALWYGHCEDKFNCGEVTNLDFPFRGSDEEKYCGISGFELKCENNSTTTIVIGGLQYRVLEIKEKEQTMRIARNDMMDAICPQILGSKTLDFSLFEYESIYRNVSFRYGCRQRSALGGLKLKTPCNINGIDYPEVFLDLLGSANPWDCNASVIVQVNDQGDWEKQIRNLTHWEEDLKDGIWVKWKWDYSKECGECVESGGRCAYEVPGLSNYFYCLCPNTSFSHSADDQKCIAPPGQSIKRKKKIVIGIVASIVGIIVLSIALLSSHGKKFLRAIRAFSAKESQADQIVDAFFKTYGSHAPKRYSYSDVKKMTNSFKDKLGQGGYGGVYRGKLSDGRLVAVKVLKESKGNGEEFINEVASISRTSHVNIVTLLGFCYERKKRALIYEFMPNGSLDKFIYYDNQSLKATHNLEWKTLYEIAIGIARGLEYLHKGCNARILHFDIKPHNILLDKNFCPKISDFGLAKLCQRKDSVVSLLGARGTMGYIAPEVFCRRFGVVSHKSDVYSYGMMVLEMCGGRRNIDAGVSRTSEIYFPHWIHDRLEPGKSLELHWGFATEEEEETVRKMILVSLCCIQTNPLDRPSISEVLEMMKGSLQSLQIPPKPFLSSPPRSQHSSAASSAPSS